MIAERFAPYMARDLRPDHRSLTHAVEHVIHGEEEISAVVGRRHFCHDAGDPDAQLPGGSDDVSASLKLVTIGVIFHSSPV